ncbi:MAG: signal peptidase I [Oscillospiraceae bacterium]|nr:signal peptidase I [Oscillospiraceae bacterium]
MAFLKKNQNTEKTEGTGSILEYLHDVVYILALILVLFTFCMRVVIVSGSSMFSTLVDGDYLLLINRPLCGELEQGDIVVASMERFKDGEPIVKRVIATEGQTVDIDFRAGIVYVDGVALEEEYTYTPTHLSEGMEFPLVVEEGCLFLMGDNRGDSRDSRAPEIGLVDEREILGRAVFLLMPGTGTGEYTVERDFGRIGGLN